MSRFRTLVVSVVAVALLSGCGSGRLLTHASGLSQSPVAVIRGWSAALASGNVRAAARFFAIPSVFANGTDSRGDPLAVKITSEREARLVNASLSCGARLVSTVRTGRYITATFTLTNRTGPGAGCGLGAGHTAATEFLIAHGRILVWIRAPVVPGSGRPTAPDASPLPGLSV